MKQGEGHYTYAVAAESIEDPVKRFKLKCTHCYVLSVISSTNTCNVSVCSSILSRKRGC